MSATGRRLSLLIIVLAALPFLLQLGSRGLNEPDEGRYVEIGREMLVTGDFLVPRLHGVPHVAKPPLTYWSIAASLGLFGMNETAARLPAALAAIFAVFLTADLARRMYGRRGAPTAAWLLASALGFFLMGRVQTTDMILAASVVAAMHGAWRFRSAASRGTRLQFFLALAVGFLAKGPVAVAIVLLGLIGAAVFERRRRPLGVVASLWGWGLFLLLALPWYLLMAAEIPGLIEHWLGYELVQRVTEGVKRNKPFWYFAVVLPLEVWPWTDLLLALVPRIWRLRRRPREAYLAGWISFPFLMFTLSQSKLPTYMVPLIPAAALLVVPLVLGLIGRPEQVGRRWRPLVALNWFLVAAAALAGMKLHGDASARLLFGAGLTVLAVGALIEAAVILAKTSGLRAHLAAQLFCAVVFLQLFVHAAGAAEERLGSNTSYRRLLTVAARLGPHGASLDAWSGLESKLVFPPGPRIVSYGLRCHAAGFYVLRRHAEFIPHFGMNTSDKFVGRDREPIDLDRERLRGLIGEGPPLLILAKSGRLGELMDILPSSARVVDLAGEKRRGCTLIEIPGRPD